MAYKHCERLSALDGNFLGIEDEAAHVRVGSVSIFEAKLLQRDGALDAARIRQLIESTIHLTPRSRNKNRHCMGDGGLFWGLNADWDAVQDLHEVVEGLCVEYEALRKRAIPEAPEAGA